MDTTVKATAVSGHQREYLFDNYKVLLILLVVIGHFIEPSNDQNLSLIHISFTLNRIRIVRVQNTQQSGTFTL